MRACRSAVPPCRRPPRPRPLPLPLRSALAATLALSSALYANDVPADQISLVLAACAAANYLVFDGTKQGLALALLCALACPASEVRPRGGGAAAAWQRLWSRASSRG